MKILLSLNFKLMDYTAYDLIKLIEKEDSKKIISGFEVCVDIENEERKKYVNELAILCKQNNLILQFHGDSSYELEKQKKYMDFLNNISNIVGKRINVVLHPHSEDTIEESIEKSNIYFSEILNYIYENNYNISISIENLNSMIDENRLSKGYLKSILANNMELNFTYDLGHEIVEYGEVTNLDTILLERLTNVHIHTFYNIDDHLPIKENDFNKEKWVKAIQYLNYINYDKTIVLEYDVYTLGESFEERVFNYIKCAEFISEYIR